MLEERPATNSKMNVCQERNIYILVGMLSNQLSIATLKTWSSLWRGRSATGLNVKGGRRLCTLVNNKMKNVCPHCDSNH